MHAWPRGEQRAGGKGVLGAAGLDGAAVAPKGRGLCRLRTHRGGDTREMCR